MEFDSDAEEQGVLNGAIHSCSKILNFGGEILFLSQKFVIVSSFYCRPWPNDSPFPGPCKCLKIDFMLRPIRQC